MGSWESRSCFLQTYPVSLVINAGFCGKQAQEINVRGGAYNEEKLRCCVRETVVVGGWWIHLLREAL